MKNYENVSQPKRLLYLFIYIFIFCAISFHLFGSYIPPLNEKGFWFYTGLASLVIGGLLVTPFYTSPANGLSYATAGFVAIIYTSHSKSPLSYYLILIFFGLIIVFSLLGIATSKSKKEFFNNFSYTSRILVENFGNPRILYVTLLFYAIIQFHSASFKESFWIFIAGVVTLLQVVELISYTLEKILNKWKIKSNFTNIGKIAAYQTPNIILVSLEERITLKRNSLLILKDPTFNIKVGFNLGYMGRDEKVLLRVLELNASGLEARDIDFYNKILEDNEVYIVSDELKEKISVKNELILKQGNFIGIIDKESTTGIITIEIINENEIVEGSLLEVQIRGRDVLYQVIEGITWEDIIAQKNTFGYVKTKARKIGSWNEKKKKFEVVKWIPMINSPVFIKKAEMKNVPIEAIGSFPDTNYFVSIKDVHQLVTHNTAILGILGVGKSFFAFELIERMIDEKIKVIVLDLTDQYQRELDGFNHLEQFVKNASKLNEACTDGRDNIQNIKQEGGSVNKFKIEIKNQLKSYLEITHIPHLTIYNPLHFDVWKQTGGKYRIDNEVLATMVRLTPCEITQIITETTLEICQEKGMTDEARVCIVFEESHTLIPENNSVVGENDKNAAAGTSRAILQGRKYGLGCLLITQRTANVTKTILNQCNTIFALRNYDETGKSFLANYFGNEYSRILSDIPEQQAIAFGRASSCESPVLIQINNRDEFKDKFRISNPLPVLPEWISENENIVQDKESISSIENEDDLPL